MRAKLVISYANGGAGSFRGKVCLKSRVHVLANGRYQLSQVLWSTSITLSIFIANDFGKSDCHLQFLELSPQIRYFFAHRYKVCTFYNKSFFLKKLPLVQGIWFPLCKFRQSLHKCFWSYVCHKYCYLYFILIVLLWQFFLGFLTDPDTLQAWAEFAQIFLKSCLPGRCIATFIANSPFINIFACNIILSPFSF